MEEHNETAVAKVDYRSLARVERYVTLTALNLPEGLSYDQWAEHAKGISLSRRMVEKGSLMWHVGDWLTYGESNIGEAYAQAVEATGYKKSTLYQAKWVSGSIPPSRRRESLSWSHHKAVAGLTEPDQEYLLQLAATDNLSYSQIKKMAEAVKAGVADAETALSANGHQEEDALPTPEETERAIEQGWQSLKRDMQLMNDMIDDYSSVSFAFWELVNNQSAVAPEDLGKIQAINKAISEVTGRIAHTIYALL